MRYTGIGYNNNIERYCIEWLESRKKTWIKVILLYGVERIELACCFCTRSVYIIYPFTVLFDSCLRCLLAQWKINNFLFGKARCGRSRTVATPDLYQWASTISVKDVYDLCSKHYQQNGVIDSKWYCQDSPHLRSVVQFDSLWHTCLCFVRWDCTCNPLCHWNKVDSTVTACYK